MAEVIRGGRDAYRALRIGGDVTPLSNEFRQRGELLRNSISADNTLLAEFYQEAESTFERFNEIDYAAIRKALLRQMDNVDADDRVRQFSTVEDFQSAGGLERMLVMVNPVIRKLTQQQRIEGYADCYNDPFASFRTEDHPVYQSVMNGMVQEGEDGEEYAVTYAIDDFGFNVPKLDVVDQVITLSNWSLAEALVKELNGKDLTSPTGASLG